MDETYSSLSGGPLDRSLGAVAPPTGDLIPVEELVRRCLAQGASPPQASASEAQLTVYALLRREGIEPPFPDPFGDRPLLALIPQQRAPEDSETVDAGIAVTGHGSSKRLAVAAGAMVAASALAAAIGIVDDPGGGYSGSDGRYPGIGADPALGDPSGPGGSGGPLVDVGAPGVAAGLLPAAFVAPTAATITTGAGGPGGDLPGADGAVVGGILGGGSPGGAPGGEAPGGIPGGGAPDGTPGGGGPTVAARTVAVPAVAVPEVAPARWAGSSTR